MNTPFVESLKNEQKIRAIMEMATELNAMQNDSGIHVRGKGFPIHGTDYAFQAVCSSESKYMELYVCSGSTIFEYFDSLLDAQARGRMIVCIYFGDHYNDNKQLAYALNQLYAWMQARIEGLKRVMRRKTELVECIPFSEDTLGRFFKNKKEGLFSNINLDLSSGGVSLIYDDYNIPF